MSARSSIDVSCLGGGRSGGEGGESLLYESKCGSISMKLSCSKSPLATWVNRCMLVDTYIRSFVLVVRSLFLSFEAT